MAIIQRLTAVLGLDGGNFEKGLQKAKSGLKSFGDAAARIGKAAGVAFAAVGAAVGALVTKQLAAIDSTAKLSRQLGFQIGELQALQLVASEAGASQEKLTVSLAAMARNLVAASNGTGEAVIALQNLGLTASELVALSPEEQFSRIAKAISGIQNPTERVDAAMRIFGKGGRDLINVFDDYNNKINQAREFNERFNVTLNEVDAGMVEEANDSVGRIWQALTGLGNTIAIEVAPLITAFSNALLNSGVDGEEATSLVRRGMNFVTGAIDNTRLALLAAEAGYERLRVAALEAIKSIVEVVVNANKTISDFAGRLGIDIGVSDTVLNTWRDFDVAVLNGKSRIIELQGEYQRFERTAVKVEQVQEAARKRSADNVARQQLINQALIKAGDEEQVAKINEVRVGKEKVVAQEKKHAEAIENTNEYIDKAKSSLDSIFDGAINGGSKFSDVLKNIAQDLANLIFKRSVSDPLTDALGGILGDAIGGGIGSLFSSGATGGGSVSAPIGFGKVGSAPIMAYAEGGTPPIGRPSLVGERGAELFVPKTSGTIIPNDALGMGQAVIVNNNFEAGVTRQEVADLIPSIIAATKNAVTAELRRGGSMSRAAGVQ